MDSFADRLLTLRSEQYWSLADLSNKSGIAKAVLHRYEKGVKPSRKNLEKIASAFKIPINDFLVSKEKLKESLLIEVKENLIEIENYNTSELEVLNGILVQINSKRNLQKKLQKLVQENPVQ